MSRGMPSMTALLGLLALAGYQNRDKLAELLKGATGNNAQPGAGNQQGPLGGLLGNLGGVLAAAASADCLAAVWASCSNASSRMDRVMLPNPGSTMARTRSFPLHN